MKELFTNKKTLIPILLGVAIIIIAIVTFVVMGTSKKKTTRVSTVKLDNTQPATNELGNTYGNTSKNEVENETKNEVDNEVENEVDEDKDFDIEEFYQNAAKLFVKGFSGEDEMQDFIDEYFDSKAYIAYENAELDDSKFMDEYNSINDDDEKIEETADKLIEIATILDSKVKLEEISEPEISEDDENISKITITVNISDEEKEFIIVFYDEIVIYIMDTDGESFLDGEWIEE
ncbi:MAG: hypothetical protein HFJ44_01300 [Clostridia bacterium]|nr:hypothetical protein [Clostridia bacterium]